MNKCFITNRGKKFEERLLKLQCIPSCRTEPIPERSSDNDFDFLPNKKHKNEFKESELLDLIPEKLKKTSHKCKEINACASKLCDISKNKPSRRTRAKTRKGRKNCYKIDDYNNNFETECSSLIQQTKILSSKNSPCVIQLDDDSQDCEITCISDSPNILVNNSSEPSFELNSSEEPTDNTLMVKFKFEGKVTRIRFAYDDCIWLHARTIFQELKIPETDDLIITYNDKQLTFDETPRSLGLTIADFLECFVQKNVRKLVEKDPTLIRLKLRSNLDARNSEPTVIELKKSDTLLILMKNYAKVSGNPLEMMSFEFDGERIKGNEFPEDLELEDDSLIDVVIKSSLKGSKKN